MAIELKKAHLEKAFIKDKPFLILPLTEVKKSKTWMVWQYNIAKGVFLQCELDMAEIEMLQIPVEAEKALILDLLLAKNLLWIEDDGIYPIKIEDLDTDALDEIPYNKVEMLTHGPKPLSVLETKQNNDILELFDIILRCITRINVCFLLQTGKFDLILMQCLN